MRKLVVLIVLGLVLASCGGETDSAESGSSDLPDPCALVDDATLTAYFGEVFEGEAGETGPLLTCRWRDENANSLLLQVASDHGLNRPDSCDRCIDLSFADDGYASPSPFQSTAAFIAGSTFYSVTTTGFGDDADSIAGLAETIYENIDP
ncbi:MAG: hypothetical protein U9N56_03535 [Actinomycetota bacterium]|nr:hypothetical protein [Actinomycetota bacterium]